jgi:two-component system, OmpR family, alkaline phosphatase synthesis response regulator PhoP
MSHATVLVVEDDPAIREGLVMNLRREGHEVLAAADGEAGLAMAVERGPDVLVLDLMLPGRNGYEVIRALRQLDVDLHILVLSARGEEIDKVAGLNLGADDYVAKPFSIEELVARVNAALRRRRRATVVTRFGDVAVDIDRREVTKAGAALALTAREFDLLLLFLRRPGRVLRREVLLDNVWGADYFGTPRTVDNFVARLRRKVEDDPDAPRYLNTVRGIGYRFDP